jgi:hypothetical protein
MISTITQVNKRVQLDSNSHFKIKQYCFMKEKYDYLIAIFTTLTRDQQVATVLDRKINPKLPFRLGQN